jgi:hypothetical protein
VRRRRKKQLGWMRYEMRIWIEGRMANREAASMVDLALGAVGVVDGEEVVDEDDIGAGAIRKKLLRACSLDDKVQARSLTTHLVIPGIKRDRVPSL